MKTLKAAVILLISFLFLLSNAKILEAKRTGITDRSNTNSRSCGECHSPSPSPNVTVSLSSESGTFEVDPGAKVKFILTIASQNGITAGCNIAVKTQVNGSTYAGTLEAIPGSGLYVSKSELTHQQPKQMSNGKVTFEFYWTAPTQPGSYYLQAVGLASNNNNKEDNNDLWNFAPPQTILVRTPSGIESENVNDVFSIYPNPISSNSKVYVNDFGKFQSLRNVSVVSYDGKITPIQEPMQTNFEEVIKSLLPGIYFLHYQLENQQYTKKLIKVE